jgi:hypothetical protein
MNFLEQVAAEYYATKGYFVRTNVKANRRKKGGWDNELDVLAYHPQTGELVHLETTWDANNWTERQKRFLSKKFVFTEAEYRDILGARPATIRKRAVVGTSRRPPPDLRWGDSIEVITVPQFIAEVCEEVRSRSPMRDIVPETYPCLRAMQFAEVLSRVVDRRP